MSNNNVARTIALASFAILFTLTADSALAAAEILLGNVASTTSPTAGVNSKNLLVGYNVYFEHVNRNGGVRGRKIRLVNKDDDVKVDKMVALTDELIADRNIVALVGFLNFAGLGELIKRDMLVKGNIAMIAPIGAQNATNFYPMRAGYEEEAEKLLQEIRDTQKKRVALVYLNQGFGPAIFKRAEAAAKGMGLNVVATGNFEAAPDKMDAGIEAVAKDFAKQTPDAVLVIVGGVGAYKFVKRFRDVYQDFVQIYTLSPADPFLFVKIAGLQNARGVIISQCVPYPENNTLAVVREYQKMMKEYAPKEPLSFYSLEGYMGAKIAVEALKRAGPNPTREKVIAALNTMRDFDLGDFVVSYSPAARSGSKIVDLTIIGRNGTLYR